MAKQNIFYVCKKALQILREKLQGGGGPPGSRRQAHFPGEPAGRRGLGPGGHAGVGDDFDVIDLFTEKLGPKGAAEAFIRASDYLIVNTAGKPEGERPMEMKAAAYRQTCQWAEGAEHFYYSPPPPPPFIQAESGSRRA